MYLFKPDNSERSLAVMLSKKDWMLNCSWPHTVHYNCCMASYQNPSNRVLQIRLCPILYFLHCEILTTYWASHSSGEPKAAASISSSHGFLCSLLCPKWKVHTRICTQSLQSLLVTPIWQLKHRKTSTGNVDLPFKIKLLTTQAVVYFNPILVCCNSFVLPWGIGAYKCVRGVM